MADEVKDAPETAELATLRKQVRDLTSERDDLKEEVKTTRGEARDRRHANKTLEEQLGTLTKERDDFKVKAETSSGDWQAKLDAAHGTVRGLKHERAFGKVAAGLKVSDPAKFADLVKLAGYQPEGDEPDEAKISASFTEALKGRAWLVDAASDKPAAGAATIAPGGAGATQAQPGGKPGPGADRGQSTHTESKSQPEGRPAGRL